MKTLENGYAEIWEVAETMGAAACGMTMAQAKEADSLRSQSMSPADKPGERLVSAVYAKYGLKPPLAATNADRLALKCKELCVTLIHLAESPAMNVSAKFGGKPTPCDRTTRIGLSFLVELYATTPGEHHAAYAAVLLAAMPRDEHGAQNTHPSLHRPPNAQAGSQIESAEERQRRRYQMCIDAGLTMPTNDYGHMPRGVGKVAEREGIKRQSFVQDVKAHINRASGK